MPKQKLNPVAERAPIPALVRLAERAQRLTAESEALEKRAKEVAAEARAIEENEIPDFMDELGLSEFALEDGTKVQLKDIVSAGIPKDSRAEAYEWLREHGHGGLIKTTITVFIPREEQEKVAELIEALEPFGLSPEVGEDVHGQTLGAWVREWLDKDAARDDEAEDEPRTPLPMELLGVYMARRAIFKLPKKGKKAT